MNLASRLCDGALSGQILIAEAVYAEAEELAEVGRRLESQVATVRWPANVACWGVSGRTPDMAGTSLISQEETQTAPQNRPSFWHLNAGGWEPSTASGADIETWELDSVGGLS